MSFSKYNNLKLTLLSILLIFMLIGCERHPFNMRYSWRTYSEDKIKLKSLPEVTDLDIKYLDKFIDANTLFPEYIHINGTIHLLEGWQYGELLELSKVYIQEQREKFKTAPDSIQIRYVGIEEEYQGALFRNKYEITNLYSKKLESMTGIWKVYYKGSYMKEFTDTYRVDLEPKGKTFVVSETFHPRWTQLPDAIGGKDPNDIKIKWIPKYLKFANGSREDFNLD